MNVEELYERYKDGKMTVEDMLSNEHELTDYLETIRKRNLDNVVRILNDNQNVMFLAPTIMDLKEILSGIDTMKYDGSAYVLSNLRNRIYHVASTQQYNMKQHRCSAIIIHHYNFHNGPRIPGASKLGREVYRLEFC